jgi:Putative beta-barrel porin 2
MKKNIITAGVLAAGVASLYAENVTGLTEAQAAKPWSVSGVVRGFYDSNPEVQTYGNRQESWGIYLSPSVGFNYPLENSLLSLTATYGAWWYEARDDDNWDQAFEVNGRFNHKFDEHTMLNVEDNFLYTDQPAVTETGFANTVVLRRSDNTYLRNRFPVTFSTKFNERFGISAGYQNTYWNYQDDIYAAQLNRVDQLAHIDLDYYLTPELIVLGGYQFGWNTYLSDDFIAPGVKGEDRSNVGHYFYVGGQAALSPQLKAALKVGAVYTDWYDLDQSDWGPYVDGSVSYNYLPGSYVRAGVIVMHNATDVVAPDANGNVTLDQQSFVPYVAVTHAVTPRLTANLLGQLMASEYDDGQFNDDVDYYWTFGTSLKYMLNKNLFTEAGYNYDCLVSDVPGRPFNRNRVYVGIGATY